MLGEFQSPKRDKLALVDHIYEGGPQPQLLMEALLCEMYGCLPSELDGEDVARLLKQAEMLMLYRTARKPLKQWSGADNAIMRDLLDLDLKRHNGN